MLKPYVRYSSFVIGIPAAFGRLCVETLSTFFAKSDTATQPPSGGCVLKPFVQTAYLSDIDPAAFGRLCVETSHKNRQTRCKAPAAFGRLCVETLK